MAAETRSILPSSTLYLDLEGNRLSRHGTISLITILIHPQRVVRLIDVLVLGKPAFTTASNNGKTLKSILEDPDIPNEPGTHGTTPTRCGLFTMSVSLLSLTSNSSRMRLAPATRHMYAG
jgi:hypothetical protein